MLIIFTVYNNRYSSYVDMWEFFIKQANSGYVPMYFKTNLNSTYAAACERFLTRPVIDDDVYITDVDMMILPELPNLQEFHQKEMIEDKLCYSASPRNNKETAGWERIAGLIYVTQEWYNKTTQKRNQFLEELASGKIGNGRYDDEKMLKRICVESGLKLPPKRPLIARHHGMHLGVIRNYCMYGIARLRAEMKMRITPAQARQWVKIADMDEYQDRKKRIDNKKIRLEFDFLDDFCRSWSKAK